MIIRESERGGMQHSQKRGQVTTTKMAESLEDVDGPVKRLVDPDFKCEKLVPQPWFLIGPFQTRNGSRF